MAHGNEVAAPNKDVGFAELNLTLDKLRGAKHNKQGLVVDLGFRPLMGAVGILDGQLMEIEPPLDLRQHLFVRLIEADPDEGASAGLELVELVDIKIGDPAAIFIGRASYHLAHASLPRRLTRRFYAGRHLNLFAGGGKGAGVASGGVLSVVVSVAKPHDDQPEVVLCRLQDLAAQA